MSSANNPFTISSPLSHPSALPAPIHYLFELNHWLLGTLSLAFLLLAISNRILPLSQSPCTSPPLVPTWPWIGSLFAYTRDPVGFIRRNHTRYGNVFTTTILGYRCSFIQSAPHVHRFATSPRTILDVTSAYKLIASGVIGEEAFIGPTRTLTRLVFAPARLDALDCRFWALAEEMIAGRLDPESKCDPEWNTLSPTGWLDNVVFALDLAALMGPVSPEVLPHVASLFRVLDGDLSLFGLLAAGRSRAQAKEQLLNLLRDHVRGHIKIAARRIGSNDHLPDPELPEELLRSELVLECGKQCDEVLRAYYSGSATPAMMDIIERKVNYIAIFIYGYVWAGQTNSAAATIGALHDILEYSQRTGQDLVGEIRDEVEKYGGLGAVCYNNVSCLTRCVNETLRLRATGAWVRLAENPFELNNGVTCPPGFVVASPTPISSDPLIYAEPEVWDPTRYLRPPFASGEIQLDSRTWLPSPSKFPAWGIGHAHCPGQHLAYKMISITLLTFFQHYDARLTNVPAPIFQDVAAAGLQRLKTEYKIQIKKR
ncbi:cytochrome P450 monooxygenase [Melampsora larici-populina 98AG31]|uniref:Cytochrome P450 monooxygenase n=1 Tax=Melampsora larici-populina (strain 98AG31 / pathotype 3-4-7) TaxID=747676 RepID=F4S9T8_MELLP|nr:cytochrome P450 monooxygenase [Melampsora larici-populina 98AG31]EGF98573.1 cytochrome P450 monooxygenase [Melampsora larici-populina 98AG31]